MEVFFALVLTLQLHAAVIERRGPFTTLEQCRAYVAPLKAAGAGCASADQLEIATVRLFNLKPSEIWR